MHSVCEEVNWEIPEAVVEALALPDKDAVPKLSFVAHVHSLSLKQGVAGFAFTEATRVEMLGEVKKKPKQLGLDTIAELLGAAGLAMYSLRARCIDCFVHLSMSPWLWRSADHGANLSDSSEVAY